MFQGSWALFWQVRQVFLSQSPFLELEVQGSKAKGPENVKFGLVSAYLCILIILASCLRCVITTEETYYNMRTAQCFLIHTCSAQKKLRCCHISGHCGPIRRQWTFVEMCMGAMLSCDMLKPLIAFHWYMSLRPFILKLWETIDLQQYYNTLCCGHLRTILPTGSGSSTICFACSSMGSFRGMAANSGFAKKLWDFIDIIFADGWLSSCWMMFRMVLGTWIVNSHQDEGRCWVSTHTPSCKGSLVHVTEAW